MWAWRYWLAFLYAVAFAIRSIWPRHDVDRVCMYDRVIATVLVGRTLACFAELAFAALACATTVRAVDTPTVRATATALFLANIVAQSCCNYSVLTHDNRGHVIEESIWTVSGAALVAVAAFALLRPQATRVSSSPQAATFLRLVAVLGPLYVAFMVTIDVPMYVRRALEDAALGRAFVGLREGLAEVARCALVTTADSYWRVEMPWMSLYFSVAVWAALWMAHADIAPAGASASASGAAGAGVGGAVVTEGGVKGAGAGEGGVSGEGSGGNSDSGSGIRRGGKSGGAGVRRRAVPAR